MFVAYVFWTGKTNNVTLRVQWTGCAIHMLPERLTKDFGYISFKH